MVVIRLVRAGTNKRPFYTIVAADRRRAVGGRYIERLGYFNPIAKGKEIEFKVDHERVTHWVSKGAQMSERVARLMKQFTDSIAA